MIRVVLPHHLRNLAQVSDEVQLELGTSQATIGAVLDALETKYPALRGTIRDYDTNRRRPFIRFFACQEDFSHAPPDTPLPNPITTGTEPFMIIGAMAGG